MALRALSEGGCTGHQGFAPQLQMHKQGLCQGLLQGCQSRLLGWCWMFVLGC